MIGSIQTEYKNTRGDLIKQRRTSFWYNIFHQGNDRCNFHMIATIATIVEIVAIYLVISDRSDHMETSLKCGVCSVHTFHLYLLKKKQQLKLNKIQQTILCQFQISSPTMPTSWPEKGPLPANRSVYHHSLSKEAFIRATDSKHDPKYSSPRP